MVPCRSINTSFININLWTEKKSTIRSLQFRNFWSSLESHILWVTLHITLKHVLEISVLWPDFINSKNWFRRKININHSNKQFFRSEWPGYRVSVVNSCRRNFKEITVNFFSPSNPEQKQRWLQSNPDPDGWRKFKNFHVCSRHFASGDMDVDVKGNSYCNNNFTLLIK